MRINCPYCGRNVDLGETHDDFEGEVKCCYCSSLMEIKTKQGKLGSVKFVDHLPPHSTNEGFDRPWQIGRAV